MSLKIIIPCLVLAVKIVMKLFVNRRTESKHFFELVYELPIDIAFLSFSFSIVYFFLDEVIDKSTALIPIFLVVVCMVVVAIFRYCRFLDDVKRTSWQTVLLIFLIVFNYSISSYCLFSTADHLQTMNKELIKEGPQKIKINQ